MNLEIEATSGRGRALVLVYEEGRYTSFVDSFRVATGEAEPAVGRLVFCRIPRLTERSWEEVARELRAGLAAHDVRQTTVLAFGPATAVAQYHYHSAQKGIRGMVLVDPSCRGTPSLGDRIVSYIERHLPLGLPFRSGGEAFDGMPYLQRLRCPVLLVNSLEGSAYSRHQAAVMARGIPTAWCTDLGGMQPDQAAELRRLVEEFSAVPLKCPQKGAA